ncbi:MAG: SUMF1/EgtB/PvdO family nonheme iron enzyme [Bacteroidales bacterium]|nr:SUMF1/EgtB/PvdO family nonheme iron enzyme [Bacteroidales bacterium]
MKKFLFLSLLTSLMVLVGCKKDVESVTVTPESATLVVGNTLQLKATVKPDKAPQDVSWSSSDVTIAEVSASGLVTAMNVGTCEITAFAGDKKAVCKLTVEADVLKFNANGVSFEMIKVDGGTFDMGGTPEQGTDANENEYPVHKVTLTTFYMGKTEVTQALWQAVMGANPSNTHQDGLPVESVNWDDCQSFVSSLNQLLSSQLNGKKFSLPTEAQWEFAARGGNKSQGYKYAGSNTLSDVGWNSENSGGRLHEVATKSPNELGLHDMSGNVYEWCLDWRGDYSSDAQTNPTGSATGVVKISRGGSFSWTVKGCRVTSRGGNPPADRKADIGLRLVLQ